MQHRAENAGKCSMMDNRFAGFKVKSDRGRQGQKETLRRSVWIRLRNAHPVADSWQVRKSLPELQSGSRAVREPAKR